MTEITGLRDQIGSLSDEAFALARESARHGAALEGLHMQALDLHNRLQEARQLVEAAPENERPFLNQLLSEGVLDIMYVVSAGKAPSSLRLYHYLADQAGGDRPSKAE
jgi:hypothetical protein